MTERVLVVGAGSIASVYADVLSHLSISFDACTRSESSAIAFAEKHGVLCHHGGIEKFCRTSGASAYSHVIVALPIAELPNATRLLFEADAGNVLVEKPGGINAGAVRILANDLGPEVSANRCFVAYNRRFYASVIAAGKAIEEDGGVTSFSFEFTELSDRLLASNIDSELLRNWEIANSTHVIDTAFFLAGKPRKLTCLKAGSLEFHPDAARYAGVGLTANDVPFTYTADWDAPGRWGIEINTRKRKLFLRPIEQLSVQQRGSFSVDQVTLDDDLDVKFKPGYLRQVQAFVGGVDKERLLTLQGQADQLDVFSQSIFAGTEYA